MSEIVSRPMPRRRPTARTSARGLIRPIYAGAFDLDPATGFDLARSVVLEWLRTHRTVSPFLADLPEGDFEIDRHLERDRLLAQMVTSQDGNIVVARLQHQEPDGTTFDPIRNWRTDVTIERNEESAWIATRNWFLGVDADMRRCAPPRFIKTLIGQRALSDLDVLEPNIRTYDYEPEGSLLADLILDADRDLPVVIIADGCPMQPQRVTDDLVGLAHVMQISRKVRFALEPLLRPVLGFANPLRHGSLTVFYPATKNVPLQAVPTPFESIIGAAYGELTGPSAFAAVLHEQIGRAVVLRLLNDPAHRTVEGVKALLVSARRVELSAQRQDDEVLTKELGAANEMLALYEQDNKRLEDDLKELTKRAELYAAEANTLTEQLKSEEKRNRALQNDKASLLYRLASKNEEVVLVMDGPAVERLIEQEAEPKRVLDAVTRAKELFEQYDLPIIVSNTAIEASEQSPFMRPKDVFAALVRIGFFWKDIRGAGNRVEETAREVLKFPCSLHESDTTLRKFGEQRIARFDGGEAQLEKHLTLGGGPKQNPKTTAQIYFGDDANGQLLVGHVGRHLDITRTQ